MHVKNRLPLAIIENQDQIKKILATPNGSLSFSNIGVNRLTILTQLTRGAKTFTVA